MWNLSVPCLALAFAGLAQGVIAANKWIGELARYLYFATKLNDCNFIVNSSWGNLA